MFVFFIKCTLLHIKKFVEKYKNDSAFYPEKYYLTFISSEYSVILFAETFKLHLCLCRFSQKSLPVVSSQDQETDWWIEIKASTPPPSPPPAHSLLGAHIE